MKSVLEKISTAALRFLAPLTPTETYAAIIEGAAQLVNAASGGYILLEHEGTLRTVHATSALPSFMPRKRGFSYEAYKKQKPFVLPIAKIAKAHPEILKAGIQYIIFIPLSYRKKAIGVLAVHSTKERSYSVQDLRVFKVFGAMASLAIRKTQLYEETKQALEIRDHFISLVAHELRTPLTSINGYIQLLSRRLGESEMSEGRWTKALAKESMRLTQLIGELLDVNRLKAGKLQFALKDVALSDIVTHTIERFKKFHSDRKVIFRNTTRVGYDTIIADFDKLGQVISNLLHNAMKFSSQQEPILITLGAVRHQAVLRVIDKGEGIAKEDIPYMFEGFYKGKEEVENGMGVGVGLLYAKYVIDYHKGVIQVHSEKKIGTTVQITFPVMKKETK